MAEFVELRMQEMLPVLEKIQQTKLMNSKQIKHLIGTLQEREFKIQRPGRTFDDFKAYFISLKNILGLIKLRREKLGYFHNESEIEERIRAMITSRFGMASRNFKHELRFWAFQINYLKGMKWSQRVSEVFSELTTLLGVKHPHLWVDASNFEWERKPGKGIENARRFVQLGIRHHKSLLLLYVQGFYLELKYVEHTRTSPKLQNALLEKENGKAILEDLILARTFYNLAKKQCSEVGPNICLEFYKAANLFPFAKGLREEIKTDLTIDHMDNELAWDLFARIEIAERGEEATQNTLDIVGKTYEDGLRYKPTMRMYDFYLATLRFLESKAPRQSKMRTKIISREILVFERAYQNLKLSEQNYVNWYQLIENAEEESDRESLSLSSKPTSNSGIIGGFSSEKILQLALEKFPKNSALLAELVTRELKTFETSGSSSRKELRKMYSRILRSLSKMKVDSPVWTSVFHYIVNLDDSKPKMLKDLISSAPLNTQAELKSLYLKHMSWTDMNRARKFYKNQCLLPGISLNFHLDMAKMEILHMWCSESNEDVISRAKVCYENAVRGYGKNNIELWLTYLSFERMITKNGLASCDLYARALRNLHLSLREEFISAESKLGKQNSKKTKTRQLK